MVTRRTVLAVGTASALSLAGYLVAPSAGGDWIDGIGDSGVEMAINTVDADCGDPDDDWVDVARTEDGLRIEGVTPAPNPCHIVEVDDVSLMDGRLELVVDVTSTLDEGEVCPQCHGAVTYECAVDVDPTTVTQVVVDHAEGERHEIDVEE